MAPFNWNSKQISKVVSSTLAAETLAMESGISEAIFVRQVFDEKLKVHLYTDNKSLLQAGLGNKEISEKRLRRDINIIKQALEDSKIKISGR